MPDAKQFLNDIQSGDADVRFAAWRAAGEAPASVIPQLGKLTGADNPGVAKAAREALATMTHAVGKSAADPNRPAVAKGLLELTGADYPLPARVHAYRLLSNIAPEDAAPAIAKDIANPDLREEVVYCLERIPGNAPVRALLAAYAGAAAEFKPSILAALGHRRAPEAAELCLKEMRSADTAIAMAAVKAFGRIGKPPAGGASYPEPGNLSEWQKIERMDGLLRLADQAVKDGNLTAAMPIYEMAIARPEEHWQCAAIIGIAKIGTAEAATVIFAKLKSENDTVRITAEKAWKGMAKS